MNFEKWIRKFRMRNIPQKMTTITMNKQKQARPLKNVMSWKTNKNCKGTILARLKENKNIKKNSIHDT